MSIGGQPGVMRIAFIGLLLLGASSGLVFGQEAGWKTVLDTGFTFQRPGDWNYIDLGGDDYQGTKGYLKALSPPGDPNFSLLILLFPDFSIDLKAKKMTYKDFIKSFFEAFVKDGELKDLKIEETEALLRNGKAPGFIVLPGKTEENVKAAMICGDLVKGNAALLMLMMDLPATESETGKLYLDQTEKIMASFAFPK